ncbi:MAG: hypothetical protein KKE30_07040 [Gammaproteobacteria bacterium]|nr:hypothetical protein [Gammaproteobacteria bacterium]MBU1556230.1 hypothetical protein [Gammaproteobacteria bacterium]MBU2071549.1 hypothetical protein [Gammaproteobacteria bacterium]MBU2184040.1 hypothetical protein [Gammaproteobacteria bacterium]MBU2206874.1 hypothetical protein [Gammaproteobacteria bacterium]
MPLQNRVDPYGRLIAVSARGSFLGNRGILHNDNKEIVSQYKHKAWVTCALSFKGIKREIFGPNRYSELFFLDEATAFSAGHRPCAHCRKARYNEFKAAWIAANAEAVDSQISVQQIDAVLHKARVTKGAQKVTYSAHLADLPSGTFVELDDKPYLLWHKTLYLWSPEGYEKSDVAVLAIGSVTVLTPKSVVKIYEKGFLPELHISLPHD